MDNRLFSGLFGGGNQGFANDWMTPEMQRQQQQQALMGLASGLLQASGPSRTPISFGQALGMGLEKAQKGQDDYMDRAYKHALLTARGSGGGSTLLATKALMEASPDLDFVTAYSIAKSGLGQGNTYQDGRVANIDGAADAKGGLKYGEVAGGKRAELKYDPQIKGAEALATAVGKGTGEAQMNLPTAYDTAAKTLKNIKEIREHPGFAASVGVKGPTAFLNFGSPLPGTDAAGFSSRLDELKGGQFLEAFNTLKGGGQITEVEGAKAEQAIARMNTAQSEAEFKKALDDYEEVINQGLTRAAAKAGGPAGFDTSLAKSATQGFKTQAEAPVGQYDLSTPSGVKYRVVK